MPIVKIKYNSLIFVVCRKGGAADRTLSVGQGSSGVWELLRRSFASFHFDTDLDFPVNIAHRGVENIPNYYYRDDGLKLWFAIKVYI